MAIALQNWPKDKLVSGTLFLKDEESQLFNEHGKCCALGVIAIQLKGEDIWGDFGAAYKAIDNYFGSSMRTDHISGTFDSTWTLQGVDQAIEKTSLLIESYEDE